MSFIKHHWFGLLMSLFVGFYMLVFLLVFLSPRQDAQKRGFIPCTEAMAERLLECQGRGFCMVGEIIKNSACDIDIIGRGLKDWMLGKQKTPWSNYIFTPQTLFDNPEDDEMLREFYDNNPDLPASMEKIKKLNEEMEHDHQDQNRETKSE